MSDAFSSKMRGGLDACNRMMRRCYTCSANLPCLDASNSSKRNDFLDLLLCAWMHNAVSAISLSLLAQVTSPAHPCHDVKKFPALCVPITCPCLRKPHKYRHICFGSCLDLDLLFRVMCLSHICIFGSYLGVDRSSALNVPSSSSILGGCLHVILHSRLDVPMTQSRPCDRCD